MGYFCGYQIGVAESENGSMIFTLLHGHFCKIPS